MAVFKEDVALHPPDRRPHERLRVSMAIDTFTRSQRAWQVRNDIEGARTRASEGHDQSGRGDDCWERQLG
jgi:hypothetical protein